MAQRALLTGANGFLGTYIVDELLDAGYFVRCAVRSQAKADQIIHDFPKQTSQLDFAIVPDMTIPGAFDKAVQSTPPFTTVVHQASPFFFASITHNSDFLDPAIKGTTSLLHSVKTHAPSIKRVIYTSSCAAIIDRDAPVVQTPKKVYTEADWNPMCYEDAIKGNKGDAYRASKKFAEQAAWKFVEEEKPSFDLVAINPPMIFGPFLPKTAERMTIKDLNESNARIYNGYLKSSKDGELPHNALTVYVDVRDMATAHRLAIEKPDAGGKRFIVSAREISAQKICDLLRSSFPELEERTPLGKPGTSDIPEGAYGVSNEKAVSILGLQYRSDEECFVELGRQLLELEGREK
jgi:nucleoside-diphosphate-sugar epimerase